MSTLTLDPRTTVSGVNELLNLRSKIDTSTERLERVASHIAEDAEFMGGKVLRLPYFDARRFRAQLGAVFHIARFEIERDSERFDYDAHRAENCPVRRRTIWCERQVGEKVRTPYTREPNRSWHTFIGSWVVVEWDADSRMATFVAIGDGA